MHTYLLHEPSRFPGLTEESFLTALALRILSDRFPSQRDEWRMIANKSYAYLRRAHSLDELAVDRVRDELHGVEYRE